jgi:hypothetical protein
LRLVAAPVLGDDAVDFRLDFLGREVGERGAEAFERPRALVSFPVEVVEAGQIIDRDKSRDRRAFLLDQNAPPAATDPVDQVGKLLVDVGSFDVRKRQFRDCHVGVLHEYQQRPF